VLLRQYLRLNAKLLGFNVDPAFGDALDALMMVDLADVEPAILQRYFGAQGARLLVTSIDSAQGHWVLEASTPYKPSRRSAA
jgi:hypothetical protein